MSTVHSKNRNINSTVQHENIESLAANNEWLNSVIQHKNFNIKKIIDNGSVKAYLYITLPESSKKIKVTVWKKAYIAERLTPWMNFKDQRIMPLLNLETIDNLNAVLSYTLPVKCSLQKKVQNQEFRNHNKAMERIIKYLKEVTEFLRYIQETGYAFLNLQESDICILHDDTLTIENFNCLTAINIPQEGSSIIR